MLRTMAIRAALLCLALTPLANTAFAQAKVAVVNVQKAILDSDEIKKAQAALEAKYKGRQDQLQQLQKDLESIQTQLAGGKLAPAAAADLQLQGQRKQRDAQRIADDLQADADRDRQDILSKTTAKMQEVVKKIAEEKGYDVVIDVSQAFYTKPSLDITAEVSEAYNKAYPAK
jgi:outer membrane protein